MKKLILSTLSIIYAKSILAVTPVWTFEPLTPTNITINRLQNKIISYRVTNNSRVTHHLVRQPRPNIEDITTGADSCPTIFTLAYKESCTLRLLVVGRGISNNLRGGPIVCEADSQTMCYRPEEKDVINVIYTPIAPLIADKSAIEFNTNDSLHEITLTNSSLTETAYNLSAKIKDPLLNAQFQQDASDCKQVLPEQSCTIYFSRIGNIAIKPTNITIQGKNTSEIKLNLAAHAH